jgi:hypothetical protein
MAINKLWNTGVEDNGTLLPLGAADRHWRVIQGPGIVNPQYAYVLTDQKSGIYFPTQDSRWIWANALGQGDPASAYVFQTEFYIELDLAKYWIQINGNWAADNFGQLTIDGVPLPPGSASGAISLPPGAPIENYNQLHPFSITQAHPRSTSHLRLNIGWHTLQVWVYNEGPETPDNPAALNLSALTITSNPVPFIPTSVPYRQRGV